jgi:20S proteasome subunit beta 5
MLSASSALEETWRADGSPVDLDAELHATTRLVLPAVADPAAFCRQTLDVYKGDLSGELDRENRMKFAKGTTTLAFKFQGGVVVSVDSRSTQGPYIGE